MYLDKKYKQAKKGKGKKMKLKNASTIREKFTQETLDFFENTLNEDVGKVASNTFNFPVTSEDGEEGFAEVTVKIVKDNDGYEKREDYVNKLEEKAIKDADAKKKKAAKIERDKRDRAERERIRAEKAAELKALKEEKKD